jgi:glycosyltransferase involved in cell wall biosynthesis
MKRKVLIIVENMSVPLDFRVWKQARSLRDAGYEVTALCPKAERYKKTYEFLEGVHIYRYPAPKEGESPLEYVWEYSAALLWQFFYSWWIYLRRGFHVIQGCNPPDDIFLVAFPFKLFGVKYIFDHHDLIPELYLSKYERKGFLYKLQALLEKATFRCSDVVMSTNNSYREIAIARGGVPPDNIFVVRNGVEIHKFKAVPPNPSLKFGKQYLVGYVGNMGTQEGLDILVDVALSLKNRGRNDIHFTCVGGGPGLSSLRKLVAEKHLEDMMTFTGRISDADLLEILSTADICVNPDKPCQMNSMSTMIKIMEYMALGKPIVQFEGKEGRFSAQDASLYSDGVDHVADFAEKIVWLLDHPNERSRMGTFGRRRIEKELAWEYSVQHLLAAYEKAFSKVRGQHVLRPDAMVPEKSKSVGG